jgi:DNA replication protein
MKQFNGFPKGNNFTPIPDIFFSKLLPEIDNPFELKLTLLFFRIIYPKKGFPVYTSFHELRNNDFIQQILKNDENSPEEILETALEAMVKRNIIISLPAAGGVIDETIYFLNTEANRDAVTKLKSGELQIPGIKPERNMPVNRAPEPTDNFKLYEENIAVLSPMIAEEIKEAENTYPSVWIGDAIREAVKSNKRNWRYIQSILERWSAEGKSDGTHRRNIKENTDPDKYIKGKYGHIVQR